MAWKKGKKRGKQSMEHATKRSLALKKRVYSKEHLKKMSDSAKLAWKKRKEGGWQSKNLQTVRNSEESGYCQKVDCKDRGKQFEAKDLYDYITGNHRLDRLKLCEDCLQKQQKGI